MQDDHTPNPRQRPCRVAVPQGRSSAVELQACPSGSDGASLQRRGSASWSTPQRVSTGGEHRFEGPKGVRPVNRRDVRYRPVEPADRGRPGLRADPGSSRCGRTLTPCHPGSHLHRPFPRLSSGNEHRRLAAPAGLPAALAVKAGLTAASGWTWSSTARARTTFLTVQARPDSEVGNRPGPQQARDGDRQWRSDE
jgi:hypothetical protein